MMSKPIQREMRKGWVLYILSMDGAAGHPNSDVAVYPQLKCVLMSGAAVPLSFLLSSLIRRLPGTERVL